MELSARDLPIETVDARDPLPIIYVMGVQMMHSRLIPVVTTGLDYRREIDCLFAIRCRCQFRDLKGPDLDAILRAAILGVSDDPPIPNYNSTGRSGDMWICFHNRTLGMFSPGPFQPSSVKQAKSTRIVRRP